MKIIHDIWFNSMLGVVGIMIGEDEVTGERKAFIGVGQGHDQRDDIRSIARLGGKLSLRTLDEIRALLAATGVPTPADDAPTVIVGGDEGEWPKGTRVEKINSEPDDTHRDGAKASIVGALGPAPPAVRAEMLAKGEVKQDALFVYWVEWDDLPGIPVAIADYRLKLLEE